MPRVYRADMGVPPMPDEGAPGPLTRAQRMDKMTIGSPSDRLTAEDLRMLNPVLEPVPGEEVGLRKKAERKSSEVYTKKMASGGYTKAADGICQRGKTRGKMV